MRAPRRVVLTRAHEQCAEWAERLEQAGHTPLILPLIRFEEIATPADLAGSVFDWILFTSPRGVRVLFDATPALLGRTPDSAGKGPRLAALGHGTRAELDRRDLTDALGLDCPNGAAFAAAFTQRVKAPARLLLPGPERRMEEPAATLRAAGFALRELPLYRTQTVPPAELPDEPGAAGDLFLFASPSALRAFAAAWPGHTVDCAVIGETTAVAARAAGLDPAVAKRPGLSALCHAAGIAAPTPLAKASAPDLPSRGSE